MFTADVPGVARSASGRMARPPRLREPGPDRGSGRRDLVLVRREIRCAVSTVRKNLLPMPDAPEVLPEGVARALGVMRQTIVAVVDEYAPPRRATLGELEALRDRFGHR